MGGITSMGATQRGNQLGQALLKNAEAANPPPVSASTNYAPSTYVVPTYNDAYYNGQSPFGFVLDNQQYGGYQQQPMQPIQLSNGVGQIFPAIQGLLGGR